MNTEQYFKSKGIAVKEIELSTVNGAKHAYNQAVGDLVVAFYLQGNGIYCVVENGVCRAFEVAECLEATGAEQTTLSEHKASCCSQNTIEEVQHCHVCNDALTDDFECMTCERKHARRWGY